MALSDRRRKSSLSLLHLLEDNLQNYNRRESLGTVLRQFRFRPM